MITARYTNEDQSETAITIDGVEHVGCRVGSWQWIDMERASVMPAAYVAPVMPTPTDEERIDAAFPQTDAARVIFEALFEVANRLQALERKDPITRIQLRDWLKAKLPV